MHTSLTLSLFALAAASAAQAQTNPRFAGRQHVTPAGTYSAGYDQLLVGDLDGDGRDDVVAPAAQRLLTYRGTAGGVLAGPTSTALPFHPGQAVLADFDGDTLLDVAVSGGNAGIQLLIGDGAGNLAAPVPALPTLKTWHIGGGDLDGNGTTDLVAILPNNDVQVLAGDGAGGFTLQPGPVGAVAPETVVVGDLDHDGHADLVINSYPGFAVFAGDGAFGWTLVHEHTNTGDTMHEFSLGHVDGDGHLDLLTSAQTEWVLLRGVGDGTFGPGRVVDWSSWAVSLADWDGDGFDDVVAGGEYSGLSVWRADGLGGVERRVALPGGEELRSVVPADVDGDGDTDLVTGINARWTDLMGSNWFEPFDKVGVLLADGGGGVGALERSPADPVFPDFDPTQARWLTAADVTGDGVPDLLGARTGPPRLMLRAGTGAAGFGPLLEMPLPADVSWIEVGEVDGDGLTDVVAVSTWPSNALAMALRGDGTGGLLPAVATPVAPAGSIALADWTGNGRDDLLVLGPGATTLLSTYVGQPNGSFVLDRIHTNMVGGSIHDAGDLDLDGRLDLLIGAPSINFSVGSFEILHGDGAGGFLARTLIDLPAGRSAAIGDLDGDAVPDLAFGRTAVWSTAYHDVGVRYGDGNGGFHAPRFFELGLYPEVVDVVDLDGDGIDDLVSIIATGAACVLSGLPNQQLSRPAQYALASGYAGLLGIEDTDGDGRPDLIAAPDGVPWVYRNQGP